MSDSVQPLWTVACQAPLPWVSPDKNTGVDCLALLQGSSQPRDPARISCLPALAGGFFTISATWEAPMIWKSRSNWV